jgi:hypothetical protein
MSKPKQGLLLKSVVKLSPANKYLYLRKDINIHLPGIRDLYGIPIKCIFKMIAVLIKTGLVSKIECIIMVIVNPGSQYPFSVDKFVILITSNK